MDFVCIDSVRTACKTRPWHLCRQCQHNEEERSAGQVLERRRWEDIGRVEYGEASACLDHLDVAHWMHVVLQWVSGAIVVCSARRRATHALSLLVPHRNWLRHRLAECNEQGVDRHSHPHLQQSVTAIRFLIFIRILSCCKEELLPCGGATCCTEQTNGVSILKPTSDRTDGAGFFTSRDGFRSGF